MSRYILTEEDTNLVDEFCEFKQASMFPLLEITGWDELSEFDFVECRPILEDVQIYAAGDDGQEYIYGKYTMEEIRKEVKEWLRK